jgi:hypothetical protein
VLEYRDLNLYQLLLLKNKSTVPFRAFENCDTSNTNRPNLTLYSFLYVAKPTLAEILPFDDQLL